MNSVCITGNLTKDAEIRTSATGTAVLRFTVAVNERVKRDGAWEDKANFIDCTMFGTRAERVCTFLGKGIKVAVKGRLSQSSWTDKDGSKRSKLEVLVEDVDFISVKQKKSEPALFDEDLPF